MNRPNECCNLENNMEYKQERPDLRIDTCKVCGSRHFELTIDPGKFISKLLYNEHPNLR